MAVRDMIMCCQCLRYKRERDQAFNEVAKYKKENQRLRQKLGCAHRTIHERPFGSSTSSAKEPLKPNATEERQARKGGANPGHKGRGRGDHLQRPQRPPETMRVPEICPDCAAKLQAASSQARTLVGCEPPQAFTRTVHLQEAWCPCCHKTIRTQASGAFPRMLLDNSALAYVAVEHFLHGVTLGRLAKITGLCKGTLTNAMHWLAELVAPGLQRLEQELRVATVIFADETVWRNDGANGYAWMFRTRDLVLYRFCNTRSGDVPKDVLGLKPLAGTLVTDRYAGYNGLRIARQFCYAHLLRDLQDLEKEFPDAHEVKRFVARLAPLLSEAMGLRNAVKEIRRYRRRAQRLMARIKASVDAPAAHAAVQTYQDIFRKHAGQLYHWVGTPAVPADNNYAERGLRPTVIARKMSYGSQSVRGARTREILMSVIGTIAMRSEDPWTSFRGTLDRIAAVPSEQRDIGRLIFPKVVPPHVTAAVA